LIVSAVEDTLRDQHAEFTPTAYFAALLALLSQSVGSKGTINKDLATSVVYLLDLTAPHVPPALLRSKFSQILTNLVPVLTSSEAEAPLLRPSIGCLGTLLIAQDNAAWALPHTQISPRRALAGLLSLAADHRPKVRKRAQEAIVTVLKSPPPSPSLDHPAADMCAETALRGLASKAAATAKGTENRHQQDGLHESGLIHSLHLVKIIATASGGWPSRNIETLCEVLMNISRSSNEFLTIGALEVFETIFTGMADERSSAKLPRLMGAISELKPAQNDSQLLPPWIAVISRGYDVSFQVNPQDTFEKLPEVFELISTFMASPSHNIRISASECLISFMANCIPNEVILEPSIYDEKTLERLAECALSLLAVKYQSAWIEVFKVFVAMFEALKWRSYPLLSGAVATIGELRGSQAFQGKKEADEVLGEAIMAMGPKEFLSILPLNAAKQRPGQQGRPWLLPLLRDHISNTNLGHFRSEFVPLSEKMYQKVLNFGSSEKTMEIKIFETLVHQIWSLLPGYCDLPLDVPQNFDQAFAEMVSNLLYKQTDLRVELCKALQNLVDTNRAILDIDSDKEDMIVQRRVSKADAQKNINHLAGYAGNLLAVLFNVYSETLPHYRGYILKCINSYLAIIPEKVCQIHTSV
jgi:ribosomal RNA-processing protein 12